MTTAAIPWPAHTIKTFVARGVHWRRLANGRLEAFEPDSGKRLEPQPPLPMRERLLSLDDLADLPPVSPLVEGLLYRDTLAQLAGPPGSYKSFVGIGLACAVAAGIAWEGHHVPEAGHVLYVAPEGSTGLRTRALAWCEANGVDVDEVLPRLHFLRDPIALGSALDVLEAVEIAADLKILLTVLDTRARCTPGLDENSATEQGTAIAAAERIQRASGGTVLGIHHTGRGGQHGRGSNAWDGAVWSDLRVEGAELRCKVHCEKHKDIADGCDHHYRLIPHTVSEDLMPRTPNELELNHHGRRSTLVAVQSDGKTSAVEAAGQNGRVLDIVQTSGGAEGLTRAEIVRLAGEVHDVPRSTAYAAVTTLAKQGTLRHVGKGNRTRYFPTGAYLPFSEVQESSDV